MTVQLVKRTKKEVMLHQTAAQIRHSLPDLADQYEYEKRVAGLRAYHKDKDPALVIAGIEAQAAMAETIAEMRERGELAKRGGDRKKPSDLLSDVLRVNQTTAYKLHWRCSQVAAIPQRVRMEFYGSCGAKLSRASLLSWWERRQGIGQKANQHRRKTDRLGNELCERLVPAFTIGPLAEQEVKEFCERLNQIAGVRGAEMFVKLAPAVDALFEAIRACTPYAVCVSCNGEQCDLCDGRGWMTEEEHDRESK